MKPLTELGKLTRITWTGGARKWSFSKAPSLAYDARGRLHIVYAAQTIGKASSVARREYARTHWGQTGTGEASSGVVAMAPFRELGTGLQITYTTAKGARELVDWVHDWGEGARGAWTPPRVVEHVCRGTGCAGKSTLALDGGTYRVTDRGIVG